MKTWTFTMGMALVLAAGCNEPDPGSDDRTYVLDAGPRPSDTPDLGPGGSVAYPTTPEYVPHPTSVGAASVLRTADGSAVVVSDPYRDRLYVTAPSLEDDVTVLDLDPGDEPGALVEDADGRIHVALRRGGALLTLAADRGSVAERRAVCPAPRGVAYDATSDGILVACSGGDLVRFPAAGGPELDRVFVDGDLRDVIVTEGATYVTRFRSAELITLDDAGAIVERRAPLSATVNARPEPTSILPNVAWKTLALPDGDLVMLHQRSVSSPIDVNPMTGGGYAGGAAAPDCATSVVQVSLTRFPPTGIEGLRPGPILHGVALAVDMALLGDDRLVVASGGSNAETTHIFPLSAATSSSPTDCLASVASAQGGEAVASDGADLLVYQREPSQLSRWDGGVFPVSPRVWLDQERSIVDLGHQKFHEVTGVGIACASCHPEGGDDGHTWVFAGTDPRRTQSLLGGILSTLPFHWSGDQPDLNAIMTATFEERMRGGPVSDGVVRLLGDWMDAQPATPAPETDSARIAAGHEAFIAAGCADCHSGDQGTNNESVELAGFGAIQVPMLVGVAHRSPWLHDGCAQTLEETFDGACIPEHAPATPLEAGEAEAIVDYLRSL